LKTSFLDIFNDLCDLNCIFQNNFNNFLIVTFARIIRETLPYRRSQRRPGDRLMTLKALAAALFLAACPAVVPALAEARPIHARATAPLVLITDFGVKDGAVSEVKGVAYGVSRDLLISDLTHEIPAGDIWEGAYRLYQTAPYWPKGTVFVGVVDPGVGTSRLSVAVKTKAGHIYVLPDNGLVTLIGEAEGIEEVRQIDERTNRAPGRRRDLVRRGRTRRAGRPAGATVLPEGGARRRYAQGPHSRPRRPVRQCVEQHPEISVRRAAS
jgi:hypothetical protein